MTANQLMCLVCRPNVEDMDRKLLPFPSDTVYYLSLMIGQE